METIGDAAAFGGTLALANQILHVLREVAIAKVNDRRELNGKAPLVSESVQDRTTDNVPYPACHYDPEHFERIKRVERAIEKVLVNDEGVQHGIDSGAFTCVWKGRDEVRDLLESIKDLNGSVKMLNKTMNNGHS
jgi:hypothetical protein